jgi:hypothetical protein
MTVMNDDDGNNNNNDVVDDDDAVAHLLKGKNKKCYTFRNRVLNQMCTKYFFNTLLDKKLNTYTCTGFDTTHFVITHKSSY